MFAKYPMRIVAGVAESVSAAVGNLMADIATEAITATAARLPIIWTNFLVCLLRRLMSITTFSSALVEITYFKFLALFHDVMFQSYKTCFDIGMQVSAKVDYGVRALLFLAEAHLADSEKLVKGEAIATAQSIPLKFLEGILTELRHAGFILSQRGAVGGYRLSRSAAKISLAEVIRVLDGPLAAVRGLRPENVSYDGSAEHLQDVWVGIRVALRTILENVTLADVVAGKFGTELSELLTQPDAWVSRPAYEAN